MMEPRVYREAEWKEHMKRERMTYFTFWRTPLPGLYQISFTPPILVWLDSPPPPERTRR